MNNSHKKGTLYLLKDVVVVVPSILALAISIKSCILSEESTKIAKESVEIANRPYLTIKPVKFEDTDSYLKVTADYNKLSVSVKTKFQVKNSGKTPAINILCPENATLILKLPKPSNTNIPPNFSYSPCPKYDLAPDDVFFMTWDMTSHTNNPKLIKAVFDQYNSGEGDISFGITLYYSRLLAPSKKYSSMFS